MKILLIAGGWSSEREVSLSGAAQIETALIRLGHRVERFDPMTDFDALAERAGDSDFAFLNLHGSPGEDGLLQAVLDTVGCPYQGSGPAASFLALNKAASKQVLRRAGLPTPNWRLLVRDPGPDWRPDFALPAFVKPNSGGSSLGMSLVKTPQEMAPALARAFAECREVLVEQAVDGVETTCAVLGDQALPPILIRPKACVFFDYQSKYVADAAEEICPAPLPAPVLEAIQAAALAAHRLLGCRGLSRTDFILSGETPVVLEVNTLPGMTATSLLPRAARVSGLDFDALIARMIDLGMAAKS